MRLFRAVWLVLALASVASAAAQQPGAAPAATSTISVFLDCQNVFCDEDYMRTEIKAVNWVRDRAVADVHILVTGDDTGAGGRKFTSTFIGLRTYAGLTDTLVFSLPPSFTDDERRTGMARTFRAGLVRYVARTPSASQITVNLGSGAGTSASQTSTKSDPWKAWVFNVNSSIFSYGEETYSEYSIRGSFGADRVTEKWKTRIFFNQSYSDSKTMYQVDSTIVDTNGDTVPVYRPDSSIVQKDTTVHNPRRNQRGSFLQVRSLGKHWSAGLRGDFSSSTYENTTRQVRVTPAVEYDVYPYSESTRRQIRIEYGVGFSSNAYKDTTIYDKVRETLALQRLNIALSQRQPWGSVDAGVTGTHYPMEDQKYRISSYAGLDVRLFKGFSVNFYGNYDVIHDQFSLAKKDYSVQQILLRQFQRGSTYSYFFQAGVRYTFGSVLNNVVNPRFE